MSDPYEVPAGATWAMARRCDSGRNFVAPDRNPKDEELKNAILYIIARKAQITNTAIHAFVYQPNHEHLCGTDSLPDTDDQPADANYPLFCTTLHADIARVTKRLRNLETRSVWEPDDHVPLRIETIDDCWRNLVYILTNPVKSGRVSRHRSYPGVISSIEILKKRRIITHRPTFYRKKQTADMTMRGQEVLPETIVLEFSIPPILQRAGYDWDTYITELEARVRTKENEIRADRRSRGLRFAGARACRKIDYNSVPIHDGLPDDLRRQLEDAARSPESYTPQEREALAVRASHFRSEPYKIGRYSSCRVSTTCKHARKAAIDRHLKFVQRHGAALRRYRAHDPEATFPNGTYLMRRYYGVPIRAAP